MSYILLINEPVGQREARTPEEGREAYDRMTAYADQLQAKGLLHAAQSLQSVNGSTRVAKRDGRMTTIDGPFAEAKELVGGYAILRASSREEAIEMGRGFMQLHVDVLGPDFSGELEIRQLYDHPE